MHQQLGLVLNLVRLDTIELKGKNITMVSAAMSGVGFNDARAAW
jgi:hypothetical protein